MALISEIKKSVKSDIADLAQYFKLRLIADYKRFDTPKSREIVNSIMTKTYYKFINTNSEKEIISVLATMFEYKYEYVENIIYFKIKERKLLKRMFPLDSEIPEYRKWVSYSEFIRQEESKINIQE